MLECLLVNYSCDAAIIFTPPSFPVYLSRLQSSILCVSGYRASPGQGPKSYPCAHSCTFCLSSQKRRQAWRIAWGMACSLEFQAWVITDLQRWHSVSCSGHSSVRGSRAGRAKEKRVKIVQQAGHGGTYLVMPALERLRQENHTKLKANLCCIVRLF